MAPPDLNATAASLLGFLHDGPRTGWELVATAEAAIGPFWSLTRSQVYRELARMADVGYVLAGEPGPRDRRPYAVTDEGRAAFLTWASRPPGEEVIRFPLLLLVALGRHMPEDQLAPAIRRHRTLHAARLARYEALAAAQDAVDTDPFSVATLRFGLGYERATVAWFDELPEEIRGAEPWPAVPDGDGTVA